MQELFVNKKISEIKQTRVLIKSMKKFPSTTYLKVNSVLRVYKKGYGYSRLIVIDVNEHFFSTCSENDFIEHVEKGDILEAYYWLEHGSSYEFAIELLGKFEIDLKILFFKHTNAITWHEGRKCLTVNVNVPFSFFIFNINGNASVFSSSNVNLLCGNIRRLSDREASLEYPDGLEMDSYIRGHLPINGNHIDIIGKVKSKSGTDGTYDIEFTGMKGKDRDRILDYIFSVYRE